MKKVLVGALALIGFGTASAVAAPLVIDTAALLTDVGTAGASGLEIALAVAAVAIGIALVRKLIK